MSHSKKSLSNSILVAVVVCSLTALVLAIVIPNSFQPRNGVNPVGVCRNNLRQIDAAKQEWMLENNKKIGDVITENDIKSYVKLDAKGNLPNPAKPEPRGERNAATGRVEIIVENMFVVWQRDTKCPNGGTYTIGRIGVNPVCSFHGDLLGTNSP